jgi:hypothetical protein
MELEKELQMTVVANYQPNPDDSYLDKVRMHKSIEVVTLAIAILCCAVAIMYNPWFRLV